MIRFFLAILVCVFTFSANARPSDSQEPEYKLSAFHTPFCDLAKLNEDRTMACRVLFFLEESDLKAEELESGAFGIIHSTFNIGSRIVVVAISGYVHLNRFRYDQRMISIAPDTPMGPVGSFTVSNN